MKKSIPIILVDNRISIYPKRIRSKVARLGLRKQLDDYLSSNKISGNTKEKGSALLDGMLNDDGTPISNLKVNVYAPRIPYKKIKASMTLLQNWYRNLYINVYTSIRSIFNNCIRLFSAFRFKSILFLIAYCCSDSLLSILIHYDHSKITNNVY